MRKDEEHPAIRKPTLLWERKGVRCSCLIVAIDHIEIVMTVNGVFLHRATFTEQDPATQYAIDKMHAYNAN